MSADLKAGIFTVLSTDANLSTLVGTRIFPDVSGQLIKLPYIVYEIDSEEGVHNMVGTASLARTLVQFTVWADTPDSRSDVNDALRAVLDGTVNATAFGPATVRVIRNTNAIDTRDNPDDGSQNYVFGTFNDYDFWYLR